MLDASRIYQEKLSQLNTLYQQKMSVLPVKDRFSSILADKLGITAAGSASAASLETQATAAQNGLAADNALSPEPVSQTPDASAAPKTRDTGAYDSIIAAAAKEYDLPESVIKGVINAESSFRPTVVSSAGAMGLMQLMPKTAEVYGVSDPFDPEQNIFAGARYIRLQLNRFDDIRLALAAYNTGPSRIKSLNIDNPDDPEQYERISSGVRGYVQKVLNYAEKYA